jgi:GNAT superfamily N-acetyltransferase
VRIRNAVHADLPAVVGFSTGLFAEDAGTRDPLTDPTWPAREGEGYFGAALATADARILIADDGEPRGYLLGRVRRAGSTRPGVVVAELESMYVAAGHRSAGVGSNLVEAFVAWARDAGATVLTVSAYAANHRARAFYAREGFSEQSVLLQRRVG